jgi:hypothetical protein
MSQEIPFNIYLKNIWQFKKFNYLCKTIAGRT